MTDEEKTSEAKQYKKHDRRKGKPRAHGTGSVFQRKDRKGKQWVAQIFLENGKTRQRYFSTEKEAGEALHTMLYEQRQGTLITERDQTITQHFECWLAVHKTTIRHSTYLTYRSALDKHILPTFGHLPLRKLTARDLDTFYARKMEEGLSSSRIHALHTVIYMALQQAIRWRLLARNVGEDVSLPRGTSPHERRTLTPEQAQKLLDVAKGHRLEAMLTLALATGMRRGELLALRWQDIDFKNKRLSVQRSVSRLPGGHLVSEPKTASGKRSIALPPFVIEALQQHRVRQIETKLKVGPAWEEQDLVFCNTYGRFLNSASLYDLFTSLVKKAGLPHMRFHDLRHSAATILLAMKVPVKVIQELLGHSSIAVTLNVYGHVLPSMQEEAMDRMEQLFGKDEPNNGESGQR
jgi:integrase